MWGTKLKEEEQNWKVGWWSRDWSRRTAEQGDLKRIVLNYFFQLYASQNSDCDVVINFVQPCVSKEDNKRLTALFTEAEFKCELYAFLNN